MISVCSIDVPEYTMDTEPDFTFIGRNIDNLVVRELPDKDIVIRAIGLVDHPGKTLDELVAIIADTGTDLYDTDRDSAFSEDFKDYEFDFHGLGCNTFDGKLTSDDTHVLDTVAGEICYDFYHHAKIDRGYPVRVSVLMIYDREQLGPGVKKPGAAGNRWEKHLYTFNGSPKDALLGIIKVV